MTTPNITHCNDTLIVTVKIKKPEYESCIVYEWIKAPGWVDGDKLIHRASFSSGTLFYNMHSEQQAWFELGLVFAIYQDSTDTITVEHKKGIRYVAA